MHAFEPTDDIAPLVLMDSSQALHVARQFVQHWKAAQHLEAMVLMLVHSEQRVAELRQQQQALMDELATLEAGKMRHMEALEAAEAEAKAWVNARLKVCEEECATRIRTMEATLAPIEAEIEEATVRFEDLQKTLAHQHEAYMAIEAEHVATVNRQKDEVRDAQGLLAQTKAALTHERQEHELMLAAQETFHQQALQNAEALHAQRLAAIQAQCVDEETRLQQMRQMIADLRARLD